MLNDKSSKLLDYVQTLDDDLSVGGFSHLFDLKNRIADGRIHTQEQLEGFILYPMMNRLVRQDGTAIQAIYAAADLRDVHLIARIDRHLLGHPITGKEYEATQKRGKRLLKLAHALYPWLNLNALDEIIQEDNATACLATVHAYINYQLGTECDQAIYGYMQSAVCTCIGSASGPLNIPREEAKMITGKWTAEMEHAWFLEKSSPPKDHPTPQNQSFNIA